MVDCCIYIGLGPCTVPWIMDHVLAVGGGICSSLFTNVTMTIKHTVDVSRVEIEPLFDTVLDWADLLLRTE